MIVAFAFGVIVYTKEYNFDFLNAYLQEMAYSFEKLFSNFLKNIIRQLFAGESHRVVKITIPNTLLPFEAYYVLWHDIAPY
jgi:hypothetical protein